MNKILSQRAREWSVLPTAALHGKVSEMQASGESIIDLSIGISNLPMPETGKKAAIKAIEENNVPYTAIGGTGELKKAIQQRVKRENAIDCDLSEIIVSTGAKQAIFQALYVLTNPGDEVGVIRPYWAAYTQILTMLDLTPVFYELDEVSLLKDRKRNPKLKALLFDIPHNPTGQVFTRDELQDVIAFAKKNNLYVISDEGYEKLIYDGEHISLATIDETFKDHIVTIFSISQSFSMMGWRLGYTIADKKIIQGMEAIQSSITAATSAVTQVAVQNILNEKSAYSKDLLEEFRHRRDVMFAAFQKISWLSCDRPQSGPYFWCNIEKKATNTLDFCLKLLAEKKLAIIPGDAFGQSGWLRIAFNIESIPVLEDAVERLSSFGEQYDE